MELFKVQKTTNIFNEFYFILKGVYGDEFLQIRTYRTLAYHLIFYSSLAKFSLYAQINILQMKREI